MILSIWKWFMFQCLLVVITCLKVLVQIVAAKIWSLYFRFQGKNWYQLIFNFAMFCFLNCSQLLNVSFMCVYVLYLSIVSNRYRYIYIWFQTGPTVAMEERIISILIAIARHSPTCANAIMNCERLVQTVVHRFTLNNVAEVQPSKIKSVCLLKVRI